MFVLTETRSCKLISVCADGDPLMIGKAADTSTLLENYLGRPLINYHYIMHEKSQCGKNIILTGCYSTGCEMRDLN